MAETTLNPSDMASDITLSNGNLTAACSVHSYRNVRSTTSKLWGKLYVEMTCDSGSNSEGPMLGIVTASATLTNANGDDGQSKWYFPGFGDTHGVLYPGWQNFYGVGYAQNGDLVMMAVDIDARKVWWGKNGTWGSTGPAEDTNPAFSDLWLGTPLFVCVDVRYSQATINFGASAFAYTPPTGYEAWNSDIGLPMADVSKRTVIPNVKLHNRYWL